MVAAEKVVHFHDKNKDLSALGQQIEDICFRTTDTRPRLIKKRAAKNSNPGNKG
jgi:hypothetical protein